MLSAPAPFAVALLLPLAVAALAWRARSLAPGGAVAAVVVGAAALDRAWGWGLFLIAWFVLASALSRVGRARKSARTGAIVAKGGARDALQVLANGGIFLLCTRSPLSGDLAVLAAIAGAGALCAAGADTWATETGTLVGGKPWSLRTRAPVDVGTSGAITPVGTMGSILGAAILALLAVAFEVAPKGALPALIIGGAGGAFVDTLLGAWWQERRWCPRCRQATERRVHDCGTSTERRGGIGVLDNDAVNFLCSLCGALIALLVWSVTRPT